MNYILYQAYGNKEIINEAIFSILTFFRENKKNELYDYQIIIYTDDPGYFHSIIGNNEKIVYEEISNEIIKDWRGKINFVHRVKIKMIQDFFSKHSGNLLYLDSDTCFLKSI